MLCVGNLLLCLGEPLQIKCSHFTTVVHGCNTTRVYVVASFPGPCAAFGCTKEREGPGMFLHARDVEGRKVNVGDLGLRTAIHSLVPRPCPAFHRLQYGKVGRAWYVSSREHYVIDKWPNSSEQKAKFCVLFNQLHVHC